MSTHSPRDPLHQQPNIKPNTSSNPPLVTQFTSPQFRNKVIEILSRTANGCLQELKFRPGMPQQLAESQSLVSRYLDENRKLFEDNHHLMNTLKDIDSNLRNFEHFHQNRVRSLEQQITALQKENQKTLKREKSIAAGHPEYVQLQDECTRLKGVCTQLTQQVATLQRFIQAQFMPAQVVVGGQPILKQDSQQHSKASQQGRTFVSQQNVAQQQNAAPRKPLPHIAIPSAPGYSPAQAQPNQRGITTPNTPIQHISQANRILMYRPPIPPTSRPSSTSSQSPAATSPINVQGLNASKQPVLHGWSSGTPVANSPSASTTNGITPTFHPLTANLPRAHVSASSTLPAQQVKLPPSYPQPHQHNPHPQPHPYPHQHQPRPHPHLLQHTQPQLNPQPQQQFHWSSSRSHPGSAPSPPTTVSPLVSGQVSNNGEFLRAAVNAPAGVPFLPPPQGLPVVPIGPAGKYLPPLMGAYVKPESPISSSENRSISKPTSSVESFSEDSTKGGPVLTESPIQMAPDTSRPGADPGELNARSDDMHTPHLTPSSSRASIGPSEAVTPLNTPITHTVGVAGSPVVEGQVITGCEGTAPTKRPSVHMDTDEEVPLAVLARKKPRLDGASNSLLENSDDDTVTVPTALKADVVEGVAVDKTNSGVAGSDAMDEDEDGKEDEIGPDGKRSIQYCLDAFTDDDDGVSTCLLCLARHNGGLIDQPAEFAMDATQEERVQHFLNEHPTAWEDLLNGRTG